jgi:hypothetical protein
MAVSPSDEQKVLGFGGFALSWLVMAATAAPLWIWQDGRYGILKALFFALFFAWAYGKKRNTLDVAVFTLIMTGMQLFSRQIVNYHQLVIDANAHELLILTAHVALTLFAAWLMSWLFDLRNTPGPTYTRLAAFYVMFYLGEFILHATGIIIWTGLKFSFFHPLQYLVMEVIPLTIWWAISQILLLARRHISPFQVQAGWKRRFRDFENTRAVVFSCLALFAVSVAWFGFVHFAIGKLGLETHYRIAQSCALPPGLGDFLNHALLASVGLDSFCLASASLLSRAADYLEVIISLFLFLVLVQALALAFGAVPPAQPPKRSE